jgi:two-component system LytT family sensor kinase
MKKLFCSFLFLCICVNAFSQEDKLISKIKKYTKPDSIRVEMLVDACVKGTFTSDSVLLQYATEAYTISEKINYRLGKIRSTNCIGNYYYSKAENDKAISYYVKALKLAESSNDIDNIIISKSNLANIYGRHDNLPKAIKLLTECDRLLLQKGDTISRNRAAILTNLATCYSSNKQHDTAIHYYNQVYQICTSANIGFGIALSLQNLGSEYLQLKNYTSAIDYLTKALIPINDNKMDFLKANNYRYLGESYIGINNTVEGINYLKKAETVAKTTGDNEALTATFLSLYKVFASKKDYKNAYQYALNYYTIKDSLFSVEKDKTIAEISTKYETEKKEATINALSQEKKISDLNAKRKNILLFSVIGGAIALSLVGYFLFIRYKTQQQNKLLKQQLQETEKLLDAEKKVADSELKALKSQMNPHFIFNALNSIQEQFMYGDKLVANEQMGNFTYLTRQILNVSGKKKIPLSTELEILNKYLALEKLRFKNDFSFSIHCADNVEEDYIQIPPMILQPFAENSLKHGLLHKEGHKNLTIEFALSSAEDFLIVTLQDNGIGRKAAESIKAKNENTHESFSTQSILQRLNLLSSNNKTDLVIYDDLLGLDGTIEGTKVVIKIPL